MSNYSQAAWKAQQDRNDQLIADSKYMRPSVTSQVLPLQIVVGDTETLDAKQIATLQALEIEAARISISSLASLATIGELDHLGGGLDLIPSLMLTLAATDYEKVSSRSKTPTPASATTRRSPRLASSLATRWCTSSGAASTSPATSRGCRAARNSTAAASA